jgi:anti-anti-sigma factor
MKVTRQNRGEVVVIAVDGKLVGTVENVQNFHETVREALESGSKRIVVDLTNAPWANSQGIGMLIGAFTSARNAGARLVLAAVGGRIRDVLNVTRLTLIFDDFDTVDKAIESYSGRYRYKTEATALRPL